MARPQLAQCDIGAVEMSSCGDGVLDAGELCDDGNNADGDGCDGSCSPTGCGNGIITTGEQCDDGNTDDEDCCTAICQLPPMDEMVEGMAGRSRFSIKQSGAPSPTVSFKWTSGGPVALEDYGTPTWWSSYHLCAIENTWPFAELVMWASANSGSSEDGTWTQSSSGYKYVGTSLGRGVMKMTLKAGARGRISVKGKGSRFNLRRLPRNNAVTVFVRRSDGAGSWGDLLPTGRTSGLKFSAR